MLASTSFKQALFQRLIPTLLIPLSLLENESGFEVGMSIADTGKRPPSEP
jgi:hypothetical protein